MPYYDNFWHTDAHENITSSPACLIVFVKSKTENQLIRFVIAYLVADNNVKYETVAAVGFGWVNETVSWVGFGQEHMST